MTKMIPTARILLSDRNKDWSIIGALSELIDNSLGEDRGNADEIQIYWDSKKRALIVVDNGRGMGNLSDLFRLGQGEQVEVGKVSTDIGKYGYGGSSACLWLPDQVTVTTVRDGQRAYTKQNIRKTVDVDGDWLDVEDKWEPATVNNVPFPLNRFDSGTMINMRLRDGKKLYPDVVREALEKTYAAALRKGRRITWINGLSTSSPSYELAPWNPGDLISTETFEVEVRGLKATVKAGIGEKVSQRNAGISVTFGHRQIKHTREPLNGWDGGKLFGWCDLAPEWHGHLTNNKTAISDEELWDELVEAIHEGIVGLLELLDQDAEQEFAAAINLEANLQFGGLLKRMFPDTSKWKAHDPPRKREKSDKKPDHVDNVDGQKSGGIPIEINKSTDLEGRMMSVTIHVGAQVNVLYDPDSELMIEAKKTKPLNLLLLRSLINDEFAAAMIRQDLIVNSGLYKAEEWAALLQDCGGDVLMVASFVKPRLFKVIGEIKKEEAAS